MIRENCSQFARRVGVSQPTVSRWKKRGRLILDGELINVEASLESLTKTRGQYDKAKSPTTDNPPPPSSGQENPIQLDRASALQKAILEKAIAEARIKKAEADIREMERDRRSGILMLAEDLDYVLNDFGALLRSLLDGRADRLGAELGLSQNQTVAIAEADDELLVAMADKLKHLSRGDIDGNSDE